MGYQYHIKTNGPEHAKNVVKALLALGYKRDYGNNNTPEKIIEELSAYPYIVFSTEMTISAHNNQYIGTPITLQELLAPKTYQVALSVNQVLSEPKLISKETFEEINKLLEQHL